MNQIPPESENNPEVNIPNNKNIDQQQRNKIVTQKEGSVIKFTPQRYPQVYWGAAYLEQKYYLAHPLALDKLIRLQKQIKLEKTKLNVPEVWDKNKVPQNKIENNEEIDKSIQSYSHTQKKNIARPDSSISRQCKTQINYVKDLKAKVQIQKQLNQQQQKHKANLLQRKLQKLINKQTPKKNKDFLIRQHLNRQSSKKSRSKHQQQGDCSEKQKKSFQIKESYNQQKIKQHEDQKHFISFHPEEAISPRFENKRQNSKQSSSNIQQSDIKKGQNFRKSIKQQLQDKKSDNYELQKSKKSSANKSFVINYRKSPSSQLSHSQHLNNNRRTDLKSASSVTSKLQLEQLTKKIRQMQQKLHLIERRQSQLQVLEQSRINSLQDQIKQASRIKKYNQQEANTLPHLEKINEIKSNDQKMQKSGILEKSNYSSRSNKSNSSSLSKQNKINSSRYSGFEEKNLQNKNFNLIMYKNRRLDFSSSIVNYNYTQDMLKQKIQQQQKTQTRKMSSEITQLKKVIRQLKLEKIKQEAIIQQLEAKQHQNTLRQEIKRNIKEKSNRKETKMNIDSSNLTNKSQKEKRKRIQTESQKQEENNYLNNETQNKPQKIFRRSDVKLQKNDSSDLPIPKRDNKRFTVNNFDLQSKTKNNSHLKNSREESKMNQTAQKSSFRDYCPPSLGKKGIIVRQIPDNQSIQSEKNNSINDSQIKQLPSRNQFQPPSPTYTGKKIFQLQFVRADQIENSIEDKKPKFDTPQIKIKGFKIPQIPQSPNSDISQNKLLILVKKACQQFNIIIQDDIHMKKYRNCVIFKTPDLKKTIVWHFTGKFYIGGWEQSFSGEGKKNGEGFQYIPDKHYFKGQFLDGKKNGSGIMVTVNGDIYQGQWENGQKHGYGKFFDKKNKSYYEGQWKLGKKDGKGVFKLSDSQYYDGTFVKSVKQGYGIQFFANGDIYKGEYKQGRFHGRGKYYWVNGSSYDGNFVDGCRQGLGRWKSAQKGGDIYSGQYKQDKKQGRGQYIWSNGCRYDGYFQNDLKHGQGRVQYPDGRQIKGEWENGKLIQIDQKIIQTEDGSHQDEPLKKPDFNQIIETPSKQLRHSNMLHRM